ncbi:MAG: beta-propeller fold lactonase family protein [Aggregatilineales bacterium]
MMRRSQRSKRAALLLLSGLVLMVTWVYAQQENAPLYALPTSATPVYSSNSIVRTQNGRTLFAANALNDTISIVDISQNAIRDEIVVGDDPRTVALTDDETRLLVTNRAEGTLAIVDLAGEEAQVTASYPVGSLPYAVVTDSDDSAFVSLQGNGEIVQVDLATGAIIMRIATPPNPTGLVLWGDFLYVTHLWSGELSLIYLPQKEVVRTISTGQDTSLFQSFTIDPTSGRAYLPQSRSNAGNTALTYDSAILPIINVVDLGNLGLQRNDRIALNYADRPVNMPFSVALDGVRDLLYVVNAGSNDLSVIDLDTGLATGHVRVGANPRGVLLSRDGITSYVHNMIDGTLTIINNGNLTISDVLPISNITIPVDTLIGAELFYTAADPRMSTNRWMSCASCHFDGASDGRVWQGFPDGARNTPALYDLLNTAPYNWSGTWDEVADVELKIRGLLVGDGLIEDLQQPFPALGDPHTGLSPDLDTLVNYLFSLQTPTTPEIQDEALVARGAEVFEALDCASCHTGATFTDGLLHDVGTDGEFNTPTLRWLWQTAPYFHDGRAQTLMDVFVLEGAHQLFGTTPPQDITALTAYLLSLPQE